MKNIFSRREDALHSKPSLEGTEAVQSKRGKRGWPPGVAPLVCSAFLTVTLLCLGVTTAVSGSIDALPAAYSHHLRQTFVQSQHIIVPTPTTAVLNCPTVFHYKMSYYKAPCHN